MPSVKKRRAMNINIKPVRVVNSVFINYCYIVMDLATHEAVLIDPAWEIEKIDLQFMIFDIKPIAILLTHHHFDHINLAETFVKKYNIPVYMSKAEIECYGFSCPNLIAIEKSQQFSINQLKIVPLFTPGHTKGAISYWIDHALFTGDTLFIEGCGMCVGKGSDPNALFNSLKHLKNIIPPETLVFPGHSYGKEPGQTFSYLLQNNIYLQITTAEEFIQYRMRKNQVGLMAFK
jgi:hydroxyacylglutathione hydrolase